MYSEVRFSDRNAVITFLGLTGFATLSQQRTAKLPFLLSTWWLFSSLGEESRAEYQQEHAPTKRSADSGRGKKLDF